MRAWLVPGQDAYSPELTLRRPLAGVVRAETGVDVRDPGARRRAGTWDTAVLQPLLAAVALEAAVGRPGGDPGEIDVDRPIDRLPDVVSGASLGALVAWGLATGQTPARIVTIAAARGRAMAACARSFPGGMIAVATADLDEALARGRAVGVLDPAAENHPDTWILSGDRAAIAAVGTLGRPVPVVGPWHSGRMEEARAPFAEALAEAPLQPLGCVWIADGAPVTSDAAGRAWLIAQLTAPARWWASLRWLHTARVQSVRILGPSRVLRVQVREATGLEVEPP